MFLPNKPDSEKRSSLRTALRLLTFQISREELMQLDTRHLLFGLACAWMAGMGRNWQNPHAALWQRLGFGSIIYVFVLSIFLWILIRPLKPVGWSYLRFLTLISLTSPPAFLYAVPLDDLCSPQAAVHARVAFLTIVAVWRVALLVFYLSRLARLHWYAVLNAAAFPLSIFPSTMRLHSPSLILTVLVLIPIGCSAGSAASSLIVKHRLQGADVGEQRLQDSGFEKGGTWGPFEKGFEQVQDGVHTGKFAIRCTNTQAGEARGAMQTITLNQQAPSPVVAVGWSRSENVSGSSDGDYSIYLDLRFQDGTPLWGQVSPFHTGTHGWERQEVLIQPSKPIKSVNVYALFRNHTGTAWFDDVSLAELSPHGSKSFFDGVPVEDIRSPLARVSPLILGGKGFGFSLNQLDGRPLGLSYQGNSVSFRGTTYGGLLLRDAASDSDFYGFTAPIRNSAAAANAPPTQEGEVQPLHLRLRTQYQGFGDHVEISGEVEDTSGKDRAMTLYYALPVAPLGLTWWDTLRESRPVQQGGVYSAANRLGVGNTGEISRYPFSCLQSREMGLSLDLPMDTPRVARVVYDAASAQYYAAFDFGLVPGGPPASFRFTITASDPAWGLRAAARQYYTIYSPSFTRRVRKQGIWMPFSPISKVENPEDFGFAFKEGNDEVAWDDTHGIASFRYTEPMSWWMNIPKGVERDYTVALDYLNRYAAGTIGSPEERRYARATQFCCDFNDLSKYVVSIVDAPWSHGALFINNCNPQIPDTPDHLNRAHIAWNPEIAHTLYDDTSKGILDGEYLDSMEGWGETRNFRRDQFSHETEPLTFDTVSKKPCILEAVSTYEFARWMAADVHRRGKLMFANGTPWRYFWYAGILDVMGTETQWLEGTKYRAEPDEMMLYRRSLCYQKPYLLLMNTDFDLFNHLMVEKYMKRSLFYAIFPGMFSHNAADKPYFGNPVWYNRDRDLFRHYIPVIQELANMGWEPVTGAWSSDPNILVERFGGEEGRPLALTVFNNGASTRDVTLTFSPSDHKISIPSSWTDRVDNKRYQVQQADGKMILRLTLGSEDVAALFGS